MPHRTELEPVLLHRAAVYTDSREGAAGEAGPVNCQHSGEVAIGAVPANKDGVTVFLSFGECRGWSRSVGLDWKCAVPCYYKCCFDVKEHPVPMIGTELFIFSAVG